MEYAPALTLYHHHEYSLFKILNYGKYKLGQFFI